MLGHQGFLGAFALKFRNAASESELRSPKSIQRPAHTSRRISALFGQQCRPLENQATTLEKATPENYLSSGVDKSSEILENRRKQTSKWFTCEWEKSIDRCNLPANFKQVTQTILRKNFQLQMFVIRKLRCWTSSWMSFILDGVCLVYVLCMAFIGKLFIALEEYSVNFTTASSRLKSSVRPIGL